MKRSTRLPTALSFAGLLAAGCYDVPPTGNPSTEPTERNRVQEPDPVDDPMQTTNPPTDPPPTDPPPTDPPPTDPPAGPTARELFDDNVAPVLQAKCAMAACHGGAGTSPLKFAPATLADYYAYVSGYSQLVAGFDKAAAPILHRIDPGPHYAGVSYSATEIQGIKDWLDKELEERNGSTPPPTDPTPGMVSNQLLLEWSGCMSLATWTQENVAREFATINSGEGPCIRCHINGQGGFIATDESDRMFNVLTTNRYFLLAFFAPNVTDLASPRMEVNTSAFFRVANGEPPHIEHPRFNEDNDAMAALQRFFDATAARKTAGTCDPPRLTN